MYVCMVQQPDVCMYVCMVQQSDACMYNLCVQPDVLCIICMYHAQTSNNIKTYSEDLQQFNMYSLVTAYMYIVTVHTYTYNI